MRQVHGPTRDTFFSRELTVIFIKAVRASSHYLRVFKPSRESATQSTVVGTVDMKWLYQYRSDLNIAISGREVNIPD